MITPELLVEAGLYPNEESVVEEALRVLWQERPQLRVDWAIYQYQTQPISLAKAAALAGVCYDTMKIMLINRGLQPRLGPETVEEAKAEMQAIQNSSESMK